MSPRLRVGLTGGIGSGKSTVEGMFARRGVPVVDADRIAREVVEPGQPGLGEVVELLGAGVLCADGTLDRARVRKLVFEDVDLRHRLEDIMHPRVRELMEARVRRLAAPYCILAIPLLLEAEQRELVDLVLVVDVPRELQIRRTWERDSTTPDAVARIVDAQSTRDQRLAAADQIIHNEGDLNSLEQQVERLHKLYTGLAESHLPGADE